MWISERFQSPAINSLQEIRVSDFMAVFLPHCSCRLYTRSTNTQNSILAKNIMDGKNVSYDEQNSQTLDKIILCTKASHIAQHQFSCTQQTHPTSRSRGNFYYTPAMTPSHDLHWTWPSNATGIWSNTCPHKAAKIGNAQMPHHLINGTAASVLSSSSQRQTIP